jgi:hypothetical protein
LNAASADSRDSSAANQSFARQSSGITGGENINGGNDPSAAATTAARDGAQTGSESESISLYFLLGLPLFFVVIIVGGLAIKRILKSTHNSEVSFQGLQAEQIVAKITSKL